VAIAAGVTPIRPISNPNCVAIPLALALAPFKPYGIKRILVNSMQAVSGAGYPGVSSMDILGNVIPYIGGGEEDKQGGPQLARHAVDDHGGAADHVTTSLQGEAGLVVAGLARRGVVDRHRSTAAVPFRSLAQLDEVRIEGLLQTHERVLSPGLPPRAGRWLGQLSTDQQLNRLGRVVIAIEQGTWASHTHATALSIMMAVKHLLGGTQKLTRFDARHFHDFVWRKFFARTLPPEDFELVMRAAFRIARIPWNAMHVCGLVTRKMGYPLYPRLDTSDFDVMIAETPYPATVSNNTRLVIRYHDAIPLLMPHTIIDRRFHQA